MSEPVDTVVIGAGVVGLAVARAIAVQGREVLVLERHDRVGSETSSRNSEVIHAGIYYPTGSLKASLCVRGKQLLYDYLAACHVPYRRCGKIIVATTEKHMAVLQSYRLQALANGAGEGRELPWLSREEVRAEEPEIECVGGIRSASTGIVDSHAFMMSLEGDLEAQGGMVALGTQVEAVLPADTPSRRLRVLTEHMELSAKHVVNAAGLHATRLLTCPRTTYFAKGHYYSLSGKSPFSRLIYPVAQEGGLGVHVTIDLAGQAKFGPDVRWVDDIDYTFDDSHRAEFLQAIRCYYPALDEARLQPAYTGIRPKLLPRGSALSDFVIQGPASHGIDGLVHLLGIESPGLTAALAIAEAVVEQLNLAPAA